MMFGRKLKPILPLNILIQKLCSKRVTCKRTVKRNYDQRSQNLTSWIQRNLCTLSTGKTRYWKKGILSAEKTEIIVWKAQTMQNIIEIECMWSNGNWGDNTGQLTTKTQHFAAGSIQFIPKCTQSNTEAIQFTIHQRKTTTFVGNTNK